MGKQYGQLDLDERIELSRLHEDGKAPSEIAKIMGRHASTIGRELKRNSLPKGGYKPASADRIAFSRCRRKSRIENLAKGRHPVGVPQASRKFLDIGRKTRFTVAATPSKIHRYPLHPA